MPIQSIAARESNGRPGAGGSRVAEHMGSTPPPKNVLAVVQLERYRLLAYNGRAYRVPPVPYTLGLDLAALDVEFGELRRTQDPRERLDRYRKIASRMVKIFHRLVEPTGRWRRALWRLGWFPNPFRRASQEELEALSHFFSTSPTRSRVRPLGPEAGARE